MKTRATSSAAILGAAVLVLTLGGPASAEEEITGALDPETYSGIVVIATPDGGVLVDVEAGELPELAAEVRSEVASGERSVGGDVGAVAHRGPCGWKGGTALPTGYSPSIQGCAIIGYTGFQMGYSFLNQSDVQICYQGKGFNSSFALTWYGTGCSDGTVSVPWGNTLAYTQVKAYSLSGVTGAKYQWYQ